MGWNEGHMVRQKQTPQDSEAMCNYLELNPGEPQELSDSDV